MDGSEVPGLLDEIEYLRKRSRRAREVIEKISHVVEGASKKGRPSPRQKTLDLIRELIAEWERGGEHG